ncbi:MAG: 23S rRNA (cytosine(1962)-C(5))-methyltransferase RlmI [Deltaproteobacteria bacterium CG_4_8_14_3_um_filter_45_9]|nr:MAG: 23S rRNA (cytosine(1962)-C(5))-methyltransferase RlmI [Deltaproteobacteria bacterium CG03_land_8_20_14_0_80_45_14]PIX25093.1 MAG: 23S rRNA (cytosine(1962)-C(5))-methyltransferase RlmI [Deltaproteobacteria bacterium CG_4_8_14_3_um_filter_45_9]
MVTLPRIILKKGREKPVLRGHPWVFSGAVAKVEGEVSPGDIGEVYSKEGQFLGLGHLNPRSQIILRLLTQKKEELGENFFRERISRAVGLREDWFRGKTNAYRVINGEGDYLPGLIVDRYRETLVLQCLTAGMERLKGILTNLLVKEFHPQSIFERSDVATRSEEGLVESRGLLYGKDVPEFIEIEEYGCRFRVNVKKGQKTGFYLDQRESRFFLKGLSKGKKILDCFCYTGTFSIHAGSGGAKEVTLIDSSEEALAIAKEHFALNQLEKIPHQFIRGDVFEIMRGLEPGYDILILDPPPFAKKKGHLPSASRGYKDLNLWAFRLLNRQGLLFTFSCSHHMSWDLFQKIVFSAALDSGRSVQLVGRMGHPWDHPINLSHPEGEYLRGLICRVL